MPSTLEPLTAGFLEGDHQRKSAPTALLPTLGGQTGLNLAVELSRKRRALQRHNVELLGTPVATIKLAEDRARFKEAMLAIGEPVPSSVIVTDVDERPRLRA